MGYKSLIDKQLKLAFTQLKDLAVNVKFVKKQGVGFDFIAGEASVASPDVELIVKVVFTDSQKVSEDHNAKRRSLMVKTKDVGDLTSIDYVMFEGKRWTINPEIQDTGFITNLSISREL